MGFAIAVGFAEAEAEADADVDADADADALDEALVAGGDELSTTAAVRHGAGCVEAVPLTVGLALAVALTAPDVG